MLEAVVSTPSYAERCASSVRQTTSRFGGFLEGGSFQELGSHSNPHSNLFFFSVSKYGSGFASSCHGEACPSWGRLL